jgi:hypothetical protein
MPGLGRMPLSGSEVQEEEGGCVERVGLAEQDRLPNPIFYLCRQLLCCWWAAQSERRLLDYKLQDHGLKECGIVQCMKSFLFCSCLMSCAPINKIYMLAQIYTRN